MMKQEPRQSMEWDRLMADIKKTERLQLFSLLLAIVALVLALVAMALSAGGYG